MQSSLMSIGLTQGERDGVYEAVVNLDGGAAAESAKSVLSGNRELICHLWNRKIGLIIVRVGCGIITSQETYLWRSKASWINLPLKVCCITYVT